LGGGEVSGGRVLRWVGGGEIGRVGGEMFMTRREQMNGYLCMT
jgi:hypothetical protein